MADWTQAERWIGLTTQVAPSVAGRIAFERFCRPPLEFRDAPGHDPVPNAAKTRMADATRVTIPFSEGEAIAYVMAPDESVPERGTIAVLHGWGARAALMTSFFPALQKAGFRVVAVDFPAHGAAPAQRIHVPRATRATHAVYEATGPWHGIVGHSFGGAVAWFLATGAWRAVPQVPLARLALVAAPSSMRGVFERAGFAMGLNRAGCDVMIRQCENVVSQKVEEFEGAELLGALPNVPTLVLHAPEDDEIPFADAEAFGAAGGHITLQATPGLGHRRITFSPKTAKAVATFFADA